MGNNIKKRGYFEIETDNKYLFFNRTKDGFLARDWDGNTGVVLTGYTRNRKENLFLVVHKGKGGLIFYGNVILPFVDRFPTDIELYKIMTTRLSEVQEAKDEKKSK